MDNENTKQIEAQNTQNTEESEVSKKTSETKSRKQIAKEKNQKRLKTAGIVFGIGIILTIIIRLIEGGKQSEIKSALILYGDTTVGQFVSQNDGDSAVYTGSISALDPASIKDVEGEYISVKEEIEVEDKVYNSDKNKYEKEFRTVSKDSAHCKDICIDDEIADYKVFSSLPEDYKQYRDGKYRYTYRTIPRVVEGSFLIKCKNGKITSIKYYESSDLQGETRDTFNTILILIWLCIIIIDAYFLYGYFKYNKNHKKKKK